MRLLPHWLDTNIVVKWNGNLANSFRIFLVSSITAIFIGACWISDLPLSSDQRPILTGHHISTFSINENHLYFGAGYCLYRLAVTEKELQPVICTKNLTFQRPAIDKQRAYAHTVASPEPGLSFMAVDLLTGDIVWHSRVRTGEVSIDSNIFVVDEKIYTAKRDRIYTLDTESGETIWRSDFNWMSFADPFLIHNNLLWYPVAEDDDNDGKLMAVDLTAGETRQTVDLRPEAYFDYLLYADDEWIFGLDNRMGLENPSHNHVFAVARTNPDQLVWYSDNLVGLFGVSQIFRRDNLLIVSEGYRFVYALDVNNGQVKWSFSSQDVPPIAELGNVEIVVFKLGQTIYGIETISGWLIWKYDLQQEEQYSSGSSTPLPLVTEDIVYVGNVDTIDALEIRTGQLLWQVEVNSEYEYIRDIP